MSDEIQELSKLFASITDDDVTNSITRPDDLPSLLDREPSSWRRVPFGGDFEDDTPPSILAIGGTSRALLYPGSTNSIFGESEAGKSWVALVAAREVIERGGRVLWLDFEDNVRRFRGRLDSMSIPLDVAEKSIDYVNPIHALWSKRTNASTSAHADFVDLLRAGRYELAVVDTMTGAMSVEGLDPLSMTDVEQVYRVLTGEIVKRTGAAVLVLDHVTKSSDTRGRYAIGSERKLSGITGAAYSLEVTRPWSRATVEPIYGSAVLKVAKDRPGYVRNGRSELSVVASIEVTSEPDGGIRFRVVDPRDTVPLPPHESILRVVDVLRRFPGTSKSALENELGGKAATVRLVRDYLIDRGVIRVDTQGRGQYLYLDETRLRELDLE